MTMATVTTTATTVTASTSSGTITTASSAFPSVPIYKPKFDWTATNLYEQFKLFKQMFTYLLINGPYSHVPAHMQVSVFLNWLGDRSYELINTLHFPPGKSKEVLTDVIEQFELYFKPSHSTFQSWYELGSLYSSQFKNQNDFLNKLLDVSKDCVLDNPNELVKFLFLVHNQNGRVHENLLKELKSDSTLQDCLRIAKLTEGTVHVEKLGQSFLANVEKLDQNVDVVNLGRQQFKKQNGSKFRQQSRGHSKGGNKDNKGGRNVVIVELITHLISVLRMEKTVSSARRRDISVLTVDLVGTTDSMVVHPQEDLDITMKLTKTTLVMIGHSP